MKVISKVIEWILAALVLAMVVGCLWQVVTRFILGNPSKWTEEFLRYALIWLTMIGVPYAYGREQHLSIGLLTNTFSKKGTIANKIFIEIIVLILSVFVLTVGGYMVVINAAGQISPALHLPMEMYYLGVPICGVLMILYSAERLIRFVKEFIEMKKEEN